MLKIFFVFLILNSAFAAKKPSPKTTGKVCADQLALNFDGSAVTTTPALQAPAKPSIPAAPVEAKVQNPKFTKLIGVHLFEMPPKDGKIGDTSTLATRFSIGGIPPAALSSYKTFALVVPLERLLPQTLDLNAFETIVLGPVQLHPGDVIIGPEEFRDQFPSFVKYMAGSLEGVELAVKMLDGYHLNFGGTVNDGYALEDHAENVDSMLGEIKDKSFSLKSGAINARYFNEIVRNISLQDIPHLSSAELDFRAKLVKKLLNYIDISQQDMALTNSIREFQDKVDRFNKIVVYELKLRKMSKMALLPDTWRWLYRDLGNAPGFKKQMSAIQKLKEELDEKAHGNWSNLAGGSDLLHRLLGTFEDISEAQPQEWTSPRFATALTLIPKLQVEELLNLLRKSTMDSEHAKFCLRYAVARFVLVGRQATNRENLLEMIAINIKRLKHAGFPSEQIRKIALEARLLGLYGERLLVRPSDEAIRDKVRNDFGHTEEFDAIPTQLKVYLPN
jgi:hypothetical protein